MLISYIAWMSTLACATLLYKALLGIYNKHTANCTRGLRALRARLSDRPCTA